MKNISDHLPTKPVPAAAKHGTAPGTSDITPAIRCNDWEITCEFPDHDLDTGFIFCLSQDADNPATYVLQASDPDHTLHESRWEYTNPGEGILTYDTESDFVESRPCGEDKSQTPYVRDTDHEYFFLREVVLSNGDKHALYIHEVYIRATRNLKILIGVISGDGHPVDTYHNGVAHGDPK